MCLYNKKGMNTWNDIYDFSEKVLSYILRKKEEEYIQPDQDSPVEKMADIMRWTTSLSIWWTHTSMVTSHSFGY